MAEEKVIAEFPKCPWCKDSVLKRLWSLISRRGKVEETLTRKAWKEVKGEIKEGLVLSFSKKQVPLTDLSPQSILAMPSIPCILVHEDYCAKCGRKRVVRAEIKNVSTGRMQAQMQQTQQQMKNR